jgi:hypothetical protein
MSHVMRCMIQMPNLINCSKRLIKIVEHLLSNHKIKILNLYVVQINIFTGVSNRLIRKSKL